MNKFESHESTLSNGDRVPLIIAADWLAYLKVDLKPEEVGSLRKAYKGEPLSPEETRTLASRRILPAEGEIDPVLKAVTLATDGGFDSVFRDPIDQKIANFVEARHRLIPELSREDLLSLESAMGSEDRFLSTLRSELGEPGIALDAAAFARRCRERREQNAEPGTVTTTRHTR